MTVKFSQTELNQGKGVQCVHYSNSQETEIHIFLFYVILKNVMLKNDKE